MPTKCEITIKVGVGKKLVVVDILFDIVVRILKVKNALTGWLNFMTPRTHNRFVSFQQVSVRS